MQYYSNNTSAAQAADSNSTSKNSKILHVRGDKAFVRTRGFKGMVPVRCITFIDEFNNPVSRDSEYCRAVKLSFPEALKSINEAFPDCMGNDIVPLRDVFMPGDEITQEQIDFEYPIPVKRTQEPQKAAAPAHTYLAVSFADKDAVKAAGARWDPAAKKWYVPEGLNPAAFARWIPGRTDARAAVTAQNSAQAAGQTHGPSQTQAGPACSVNQVPEKHDRMREPSDDPPDRPVSNQSHPYGYSSEEEYIAVIESEPVITYEGCADISEQELEEYAARMDSFVQKSVRKPDSAAAEEYRRWYYGNTKKPEEPSGKLTRNQTQPAQVTSIGPEPVSDVKDCPPLWPESEDYQPEVPEGYDLFNDPGNRRTEIREVSGNIDEVWESSLPKEEAVFGENPDGIVYDDSTDQRVKLVIAKRTDNRSEEERKKDEERLAHEREKKEHFEACVDAELERMENTGLPDGDGWSFDLTGCPWVSEFEATVSREANRIYRRNHPKNTPPKGPDGPGGGPGGGKKDDGCWWNNLAPKERQAGETRTTAGSVKNASAAMNKEKTDAVLTKKKSSGKSKNNPKTIPHVTGTGTDGSPMSLSELLGLHFGSEGIQGMVQVKMINKRTGKAKTVLTARNDELPERVNELWMMEDQDYYLTKNAFTKAGSTEGSDLRTALNVVVDLDCHGTGNKETQELVARAKDVVINAAEEGDFPMPNTLIETGRGLQLVWACHAVPLRKYGVKDAVARAESSIFNAVKEVIDVPALCGMDPDASVAVNPAGLFRLPGSPNSVSGTQGTFTCLTKVKLDLMEVGAEPLAEKVFPTKGGVQCWLEVPFKEANRAKEMGAWWDEDIHAWYVPHGVDMEPFACWFTDKDMPAIAKERKKAKAEKELRQDKKATGRRVRRANGYFTLPRDVAEKRAKTLEKLFDLRKSEGIPFGPGSRDIFLLHYYCSLLYITDPDDAMNQTLAFNSRLVKPLSEQEVKEYMKTASKKKYAYSDARMVSDLGISEEECKKLHIRPEIAKGWRDYSVIKAENEAKKAERNRKIIALYNEGLKPKEIAGQLGIASVQTIYNVLKKEGQKTQKETKAALIEEALLQGMSIADAAAYAGVTERTVRNHMKRMNAEAAEEVTVAPEETSNSVVCSVRKIFQKISYSFSSLFDACVYGFTKLPDNRTDTRTYRKDLPVNLLPRPDTRPIREGPVCLPCPTFRLFHWLPEWLTKRLNQLTSTRAIPDMTYTPYLLTG